MMNLLQVGSETSTETTLLGGSVDRDKDQAILSQTKQDMSQCCSITGARDLILRLTFLSIAKGQKPFERLRQALIKDNESAYSLSLRNPLIHLGRKEQILSSTSFNDIDQSGFVDGKVEVWVVPGVYSGLVEIDDGDGDVGAVKLSGRGKGERREGGKEGRRGGGMG